MVASGWIVSYQKAGPEWHPLYQLEEMAEEDANEVVKAVNHVMEKRHPCLVRFRLEPEPKQLAGKLRCRTSLREVEEYVHCTPEVLADNFERYVKPYDWIVREAWLLFEDFEQQIREMRGGVTEKREGPLRVGDQKPTNHEMPQPRTFGRLAVKLREARLQWFHNRFLQLSQQFSGLRHLSIDSRAALREVGADLDESDPGYPLSIDLSLRDVPGIVYLSAQIGGSPSIGSQIGKPTLLHFDGSRWYGCFHSPSNEREKISEGIATFRELGDQLWGELYEQKGIRCLCDRWLDVLYETLPQGRCWSTELDDGRRYPIAWLPWDVFMASARAIERLSEVRTSVQVPGSDQHAPTEASLEQLPAGSDRTSPIKESEPATLESVFSPQSPPENPGECPPLPRSSSLATIVIAGQAIITLDRIRTYDQTAIDPQQMEQLLAQLIAAMNGCLQDYSLTRLREIFKPPSPGGSIGEAVHPLVILALMHLSAYEDETHSAEERSKAAIEWCQRAALESVRSIAFEIGRIEVFDCWQLKDAPDSLYEYPRGHLRLLSEYWSILQQIVVAECGAYMFSVPHPLLR